MQIILKAAQEVRRVAEDLAAQVASRVASATDLSEHEVRVERVFPEALSGNHSRLYVVHVPDDLPRPEINKILSELQQLDSLESASLPEPRRPM